MNAGLETKKQNGFLRFIGNFLFLTISMILYYYDQPKSKLSGKSIPRGGLA